MTVQTTAHRNDYTGNGTTVDFAVSFYFLETSHLKVYKTTIADGTTLTLTEGVDYTVTGAGVGAGGTVTLTSAPSSSYKISILRDVPYTQLTHYVENDPFPAIAHENALDKLTMSVQQLDERIDRTIKLSPTNTMASVEFTVPAALRANKVFGFDAAGELTVTQELGVYRGNWAASTTYAARDLVKDSSNQNVYICTTGHTSTGTTPISTNADVAKWELILDASSLYNFSQTYYGPYASAPTTRPNGTSRTTGDVFFNSTLNQMYVWDGTTWAVAYSSSGGTDPGAAQKANNLSDLASVSTARTNLGLGTAALLASSAVAQTANNLSDLASATTARTNLGLGSMATASTSSYLAVSNNLSDLGSATTARTNLGLGTMATQASTSYLAAASNLSDVGNAATSRTNLGLTSIATTTPGTGVTTALAVNVGSSGAFVTNGGALGTPSSGDVTACTGSRKLLATLTASNSASLADTGVFTSTYANYEMVLVNILPASGSNELRIRYYIGGAYQTASYEYQGRYRNDGGGGDIGATGAAQIVITNTGDITDVAAGGMNASIRLSNPSNTSNYKVMRWLMGYFRLTSTRLVWNSGVASYVGGTGAVTGIQFYFQTGNIASGTIYIYGWN